RPAQGRTRAADRGSSTLLVGNGSDDPVGGDPNVSADGDHGHDRATRPTPHRAATRLKPTRPTCSAAVIRGPAWSERRKEADMPAKTEKQRKFMGAELERKREGKKTRTDMSEKELEKMASKGGSKKKS